MKVAILGFGTVGKSVYELISNTRDFEVSFVLVRPGKCTQPFMVSDINQIVNDRETSLVVECIGGVDVPYEYVSACLKAKKHVVSSNKALVAEKGIELNDLALENNVAFLFSAACGGATTVLNSITLARRTASIEWCRGIINGTCNFILSGLEKGIFTNFDQAVKKAQDLGYAEKDPTADISGLDTLRKVILLSAVSFDLLPKSGFLCEGIENIDLSSDLGKTVKLVGFCGLNKDNSLYAFVEPVVLDEDSVFKGVGSNLNIVSFSSAASGVLSIIGQGAGGYPTASAVLKDMSEVLSFKLNMLRPECRAVNADNSKIKHRYLVINNNVTTVTDYICVEEMHNNAKQIRTNGGKIFFASLEEK